MSPHKNDVWVTSTEIPYCDVHYPDLGSTSDWLKENSLEAQPIRSTTKIWVVHVISMEFLRSLLRHHFARAQVATSWNISCFLRLCFVRIGQFMIVTFSVHCNRLNLSLHSCSWLLSLGFHWWGTLSSPCSSCDKKKQRKENMNKQKQNKTNVNQNSELSSHSCGSDIWVFESYWGR